ncbi:MAG: site-specific integrase [Microvirga sp.]
MLTNTQARAAKPREDRYEITCDGLPGFILRVLPTGKKVFFVRLKGPDGKDRRHRLGLMGADYGVDEARREAMAMLVGQDEPAPAKQSAPRHRGRPAVATAAVPAPQTPVPAPQTSPKSPTLREFAERFEHDHIDMYLKPQTASHYRHALRRYIVPALGDRRLDAITTADVQRLHNSLHDKPGAANFMRAVLSALFTKADEWEVAVRRNPVTRVGRFEETPVERFLSPEERQALERVLDTAERTKPGHRGHANPAAIHAIRLLALTGMRRDEVRDLCWEQVDWRRSILRLPDSKTGKRDVIVSDEVMALLARIAREKGNPSRGRVICSSGGNKLYSLGTTWANLRALAGIPDVRLHDLRHSVASDAIMNGVPLEVVGKMLGHRNYHTTQRYAHIADTALRDAVNLTSKTIVRAARGQDARSNGRR